MTVSSGSGWELRLGRWQGVLVDVECDAVIVDAPYSARTHAGHNDAVNDDMRNGINYSSMSDDSVREFVAHFSPRCRGWFVSITDHVLAPVWAAALETACRYVFAPLPLVETGSRVRMMGDGPSCWTCWIVVARPRNATFHKWGTLPGAYIGSGKGDREHIGGKDSGIMRAIIRDYTRPGDLVCDPCAGAATTCLAAVQEGRRAIGSEMDPDTYAKAVKRLQRGHTPPLFTDDLR